MGLEEEMTVVVSSVFTVLVRCETWLLRRGSAAGDKDLWLVAVIVGVMVEVVVVVVVESLPAGLSAMSASREVGGEAALPVAGDAAGGLSSFRDGLEGSEIS